MNMKYKLLISHENYYAEYLQLIEEAIDEIIIFNYIVLPDPTVFALFEKLKRKAQAGIRVTLVLDYIGSWGFPRAKVRELKKVGIKVKWFNPFKASSILYLGRRMHAKVLLVDGTKSIVGGINLGRNFLLPNKSSWLDFGILAKDVQQNQDLKKICDFYIAPELKKITFEKHNKTIGFVSNDFMRGKRDIYLLYLEQMRKAEEEIIIVSSYFVPNLKLLNEILDAAKRGVQVSIMVGHYSDVKWVRDTLSYIRYELCHPNIHFYLWKESILHAKLVIIDKQWCSIGSYNLHFTSLYGNVEINLNVEDRDFIAFTHQKIQQYISVSKELIVEQDNSFEFRFSKLSYFFHVMLAKFSLWWGGIKDRENSSSLSDESPN
jgi:cardiolipin synthase